MTAPAPAGFPLPLRRFVARFDRREYWLAHEELEDLWQRDRRDFFKGMIQIAAAHVHIERRNWRGARRLLRTGLEHIEGVSAHYQGFDVDAVRARATAALQRVAELAEQDAGEYDDRLFFELAPLFEGDVSPDLVEDEPLPYRVRRYEEGYRPVGRKKRN
ncbi:MAG: DUF309 domain-containing protein [Acidobacteriota bacterium]|jgi:hypothetical protein